MRRRTSTCIKTCTGLVISVFVFLQLFNTPNYTQNGEHGSRQGRLEEKETEGFAELGKNRRLARVDKIEPSGIEKLPSDDQDAKIVVEENNNNNITSNINNSSSNNSSISSESKFPQNSLAGERVHGLPNVTNSREDANPEKLNISEILANIEEMNKEEALRNDDLFGPITNDTVVIVIQVHNRITYLRHLIISLSMARDIDKTLLIFSHDVWDEDINRLVRSIDFTAVMQIFYPFSLQTHPHSFPGESRRDCPRDAKKPQAERMKCLNKDWPDLYGHYREAKFTQTKHHWWWKANQVFGKLSVTSNFDGTVLFLEEDHYVSEDFLHVLQLMLKEKGKADVLCLGTYLKKFNYKKDSKLLPAGGTGGGSGVIWPHTGPLRPPGVPPYARGLKSYFPSSKHPKTSQDTYILSHPPSQHPGISQNTPLSSSSPLPPSPQHLHDFQDTFPPPSSPQHPHAPKDTSLPPPSSPPAPDFPLAVRGLLWLHSSLINSVLSVFTKEFELWKGGPVFASRQKVEVTQWVSSKHNMGMTLNRNIWNKILKCSPQFCQYDDYNWDWSLQHVSLTCLQDKIQVMLIKGPRVFHIGECGVHHKKSDCETSKVIEKVKSILTGAAEYLFPQSLAVVKSSTRKKIKLKKGNGGWGDKRDHALCLNMTRRH